MMPFSENSFFEKVLAEGNDRQTPWYLVVTVHPRTVHTRPTGLPPNTEYEEISVTADISYKWTGDHGLLAELTPSAQYHKETELAYEESDSPAHTHPDINKNTKEHKHRRLKSDQEEAKINRHIRTGHLKAMAENIHEMVKQKSYEQLKTERIGYKGNHPREYFTHLNKV